MKLRAVLSGLLLLAVMLGSTPAHAQQQAEPEVKAPDFDIRLQVSGSKQDPIALEFATDFIADVKQGADVTVVPGKAATADRDAYEVHVMVVPIADTNREALTFVLLKHTKGNKYPAYIGSFSNVFTQEQIKGAAQGAFEILVEQAVAYEQDPAATK